MLGFGELADALFVPSIGCWVCSSSGLIDYDEFFEFIDETKTPFSEGLFRMIDSDNNGTVRAQLIFAGLERSLDSCHCYRCVQIDYEEFVHAMVLYCMYTRDEILHCESWMLPPSIGRSLLTSMCECVAVAFDTFDPAMTGSIGEKEFKRLISIVNDGKPVFPGNFKNALTEFDRYGLIHYHSRHYVNAD